MSHLSFYSQQARQRQAELRDEEVSSDSDGEDLEAGILIRLAGDRDLTPEEEMLTGVVFEEHLLDGLPNWLNCLFNGLAHKYHIQYWPEHMK